METVQTNRLMIENTFIDIMHVKVEQWNLEICTIHPCTVGARMTRFYELAIDWEFKIFLLLIKHCTSSNLVALENIFAHIGVSQQVAHLGPYVLLRDLHTFPSLLRCFK